MMNSMLNKCKNCLNFISRESHEILCSECLDLKNSLQNELSVTEERINKLHRHQYSLQLNSNEISDKETNRRLMRNLQQLDKKKELIKLELKKLNFT
jgi:hypothetical protein